MANSIKTIETLVKISENAVEEKQKEISAIQNRLDAIKNRKKELLEGIEKEAKLASESDDPLLYEMSGKFHAKAEDEIDLLDQAADLTEKELEEKRDELLEVYQELKTNDIVLKRKKEQLKKDLDKKSVQEIDEISAGQFSRKK